MLALAQVHSLLVAEQSRDIDLITEAIAAVLAVSPETNLLEVDEVFRDAGSPVYLKSSQELTIVSACRPGAARSIGSECRRKKTATRWRSPRAIHNQGRAALAAKSLTAT